MRVGAIGVVGVVVSDPLVLPEVVVPVGSVTVVPPDDVVPVGVVTLVPPDVVSDEEVPDDVAAEPVV
ncbi:hypothetical protein, partial [Bradyrhizobium sp. ARR65]|uniref:hypothetical protein n=1 Tax=Bradyrhizobium sp. ARR65 TaxID=1040989 RepID=UPI0004647734